MRTVTAWTVLLLGTLLVVGGVPGVVAGVRDGEPTQTVVRVAVLVLVVLGMVRATRQLRPTTS